MIERKKSVFKKLCLVLKKGTLCILLVEYLDLSGKIHFCRIYKNKIVFRTNDGAEETPNLVLPKISLLKYLLLLMLVQGKDYIVSDHISDEKLHYKLGRE